MTDVMSFTLKGERLPGALRTAGLGRHGIEGDCSCTGCNQLRINQRVRDLELVCKAYRTALNHLLVSLPASHSKDLKYKIYPEMEAAEMILDGE